jgi:V/A-type H+-transporting ATPase subunit I
LQQLNSELAAIAKGAAPSLQGIELAANRETRLLEAQQHFRRTGATALLTGWIPASRAPELQRRAREITAGRCTVELASARSAPEQAVPVLLPEPRWLRPFNRLVTAYGLPGYCEVVPTLFLALSYVLMFGMMFGDAGHGAVLLLGGCLLSRLAKSGTLADAGRLLMLGGLASMAFGWAYGSCFGLESFRRFALWQDPLQGNPLQLMGTAIGIGVVLMSVGLVLNVINRWRRGDVLGAWLDRHGLAGMIFYWGALTLVLNAARFREHGLMQAAVILFLAVPLLGWVMKEPVQMALARRTAPEAGRGGGWLVAVSESLVGAFEAVLGYLANTISFVRLAAYAMSHAALLAAAFTMAEELKQLPSGGAALAVVIVVLGNAVAIVLEGIVASVQALRLEYYEFFGKFFGGGGRAFRPFCLPLRGTVAAPA